MNIEDISEQDAMSILPVLQAAAAGDWDLARLQISRMDITKLKLFEDFFTAVLELKRGNPAVKDYLDKGAH